MLETPQDYESVLVGQHSAQALRHDHTHTHTQTINHHNESDWLKSMSYEEECFQIQEIFKLI